jgi:hypothetical protein
VELLPQELRMEAVVPELVEWIMRRVCYRGKPQPEPGAQPAELHSYLARLTAVLAPNTNSCWHSRQLPLATRLQQVLQGAAQLQ